MSSGIQASGIVLDAKVAPGEQISHNITINIDKNESPSDFIVEIADWKQGSDGSSGPATDNNTHPYSAKDFFRVSPEKFHLEPGESQTIMVKGEITRLTVDTPVSDKQQDVSIMFNNTGNVHYKVQIDAFLKDRAGNVLANASAPLSNNIIPGALRVFNLSLKPEDPLKSGEYNVSAEVRLDDRNINRS